MEFPSTAPQFSLQGVHTGRVVSLHDGDTFTAIVKLGETFYKFSVRLSGIDTCEMTSKDEVLKAKAFMARDRFFNLITNFKVDTLAWRKKDFDEYFQRNYTLVTMNCKEMDKYGRVLSDVNNFADILIGEKLAYEYNGGTKLTESEQKKLLS